MSDTVILKKYFKDQKNWQRIKSCIFQSILTSLLGVAPAWAYDKENISHLLGWISDPHANLCEGYYEEPQDLKDHPIPGAFNQSSTRISYSGPGTLSTRGQSTIDQNIMVTQPGRIATADKAVMYRDPETTQISYIYLQGHVKIHEFGKLVTGPYCTINFKQHTVDTGPAAYHLFEDPKQIHNIVHPYDAWGTADRTLRDSKGILHLWNATYTTCAPTNPTWQISAGNLILDKDEGIGTAYNMLLRFYDVPLLYVPIYTFPIDNRRKTGFLTPNLVYSSKNGAEVSLPYYWNMAPNYDLTTTPKYFQNRGFQLNSEFRYLASPGNDGNVFLGFLPDDSEFNQFRETTLANPPIVPEGVSDPYLNALQSDMDFRAFLHVQHNARFDENWAGHINTNYVTDDYYLKDFGNSYGDIVANQLLNQADLEYTSDHWNFIGLLQGYQTLHRIDQITNPAINQYIRLPELNFSGDYADFWWGNNFDLSGQSVNFLYQSEFLPTSSQMPVGERVHLRPSISHPFLNESGYITPQLALDNTSYATQLAAQNIDGENINADGTRTDFNASRNIPIFDIDSGLYFDQYLDWGNHSYLNTLEPRLFYLYVPYVNQDKYPNFDSELLPFTFPQLFDVNRFTSYDRLENANQISLGITSRLLDADTSNQKLKFDLGFGYNFDPSHVCLDASDCQSSTYRYVSPQAHLSPLVTQLTYNPWENWATTASYAWDSILGVTNNAQVGINYNFNQTHIFNFNYQYVREQNGDPEDSFGRSDDTSLISSGAALPLSEHWSVLAFDQYNLSKQRPDSYYGGIQYDACCFTMRFIASRSFSGEKESAEGDVINEFKNAYYFQLQLKSLGNVGSSPGTLLSNTLTGFLDPFK